ncbi:MAG TPA: hypothetical protein VGO93_31125 [Candidatus Xenobia bacterium]|jgi:hypothetical protein
MAKRQSKRTRRDGARPEQPPPGGLEVEEEDQPEPQSEPVAPGPPPPPDTNVKLAIVGFAVIGALMGGFTGLGSWGMPAPPLLPLTNPVEGTLMGLLGGLTMGATAGHSLLLPFRWQAVVLLILVTLAFTLFDRVGPWGLSAAGFVSFALSFVMVRLKLP